MTPTIRRILIGAFFCAAYGGLAATPAGAQTRTNLEALEDSEARSPQLTICSQNLQMYGRFQEVRAKLKGISAQEFKDKEAALTRRMVSAKCDVVAVQELVSGSDEKAQEVLDTLAAALRRASGRTFRGKVGSTNDEGMRNGILVAVDRASIESFVSYHKIELPKLSAEQKPRFFGRGPIEAQLSVKPRGESARRVVTIVNYHFKSRAGAEGDPTSLEWETYRMEMAEALRRVLEERHRGALASADSLLVVTGDRNSDFDSATAKILDGTLTLEDFQSGALCRLGKRGTPLCQAGAPHTPILYSVLTLDPQLKLTPGTFLYKKKGQWLDDILLSGPALGYAWESAKVDGDFASGVVSEPEEASDHALVYVRLFW